MTRALIVEDSPTQALELQLILESEGFDVDIAPDGQTGLDRFGASPFDLVLSDVVMPGLSGYELCRKIKAGHGTAVPVVLLTSLHGPMDIIEGLHSGADNFITKPYEPEYLIRRIKTILTNKVVRAESKPDAGIKMFLSGKRMSVTADKQQILDLLISSFEELVQAQVREEQSRRAQEVLRESQAFLQATLNALAAIIFVLDQCGTILAVNCAWKRWATSRLPFGEACGVGKNYLELCDAAADYRDAGAQIAAGIRRIMAHETSELHLEVPCQGPDGNRWFAVQATRIEGAGPARVVVAHEEITERKQAEEAIRTVNAQLERRVLERTAQLEVANKELEAFSYSASHDLRAPLRHIDGFSRILLKEHAGRLDKTAVDYLDRIQRSTQRMAQLVDDLLQLSHVARCELTRGTVDVSALAQQIASELSQSEPQRRVEFAIAPGITASGDARLLRVALDNLMGNAWKFTSRRARAKIELGVSNDGTPPVIYLRDDGAGFDMAHAPKLFRPFQRLHETREFPGTGIGLATVERIIRRHGGRVWAEAAPEAGATFYFTVSPSDTTAPTY